MGRPQRKRAKMPELTTAFSDGLMTPQPIPNIFFFWDFDVALPSPEVDSVHPDLVVVAMLTGQVLTCFN